MVRGVDADWQFDERRRTIRFKCRHKVDILQGEGEAEQKTLGYVMNYSMGGVRLAHPGGLKVGEVVRIRFPHPLPGVTRNTVKCEVVWRRKNSKTLEMLHGAKFLESGEHMMQSWVSYFFRERGAAAGDLREDRAHVRCECKLDVLARGEEERAQGRVLNIGLGGALLALNRPAEVGDEWGLDISGLSSFEAFHVKGIVQSCETGKSGLFNQRMKFLPPEEEQEKVLKKYQRQYR